MANERLIMGSSCKDCTVHDVMIKEIEYILEWKKELTDESKERKKELRGVILGLIGTILTLLVTTFYNTHKERSNARNYYEGIQEANKATEYNFRYHGSIDNDSSHSRVK